MAGWRVAAYRAVRPLLFFFDAEAVHEAALGGLSLAARSTLGRRALALASGCGAPDRVGLLGLNFRNRVGLAAGFDKDGRALAAWAALGFGFVELGTVTPRPQPGNPRPRLFRLRADDALVNRMGFNNAGADALARRLAAARPMLPDGFVVGVNIGRTRDGTAEDYAAVAGTVAAVADYLAVNVSSPNTPGLRDLQEPTALAALLPAVAEAALDRPILVKLSPDLAPRDREAVLRALADTPAAGLILSNTTVNRPPTLRSGGRGGEPGGLSGRLLLATTLRAIEQARATCGDRFVLIASGGVTAADDARRLRDAGADLVQLWTGMIYAGPGLVGASVAALREASS